MPAVAAACLVLAALPACVNQRLIGLPVGILRRVFRLAQGSGRVLTRGGLGGGIAVAPALSLPAGTERNTLVGLTYVVVVRSILGQGLTPGRAGRRAIVMQPA